MNKEYNSKHTKSLRHIFLQILVIWPGVKSITGRNIGGYVKKSLLQVIKHTSTDLYVYELTSMSTKKVWMAKCLSCIWPQWS